ncbi:serine-threonine protein kinase-like protein [Nannochloropsis oceanica]
MPQTNHDPALITRSENSTPTLPLPYGVLTLEYSGNTVPSELQGVPTKLFLARSSHTVGRIAAPGAAADGVGEGKKGTVPVKVPRHYVINKAYISSMHCRLQVVEEDGKGKGSKDDEENENGISLNHHQCEEADEQPRGLSIRLTDTSTYGTHVNGATVGKEKSVFLQDGDLVTLFRPRDARKPALSYIYRARPEGRTQRGYWARRHDDAFNAAAAAAAAPSTRRPSVSPSLVPDSAPPSLPPSSSTGTGSVLEEMRKKNVGLQERMEALEEEGKAAKTRVQEAESAMGKQKEAHATAIEALQAELASFQAAAAQAEAGKEGGKEEGEAAALREELAAHQSIVEGLRLRVGEKERAVSELQQDKVELEEKVAELGGSLATERRERDRVNTALEKETSKAKTLEAKAEELKIANIALEEDYNRVSSELRREREEKEDARRLLEENNSALTAHEGVKGELMELRTIVENQKEELERKRKEVDRLRGHVSKHEAVLEEKLAAQQQTKAAEKALEAKTRELNTLSSRLSSLQSFQAATTDEVASLRTAKSALEASRDNLASAVTDMEGKWKEAAEKVKHLRDRVSQLETGKEAMVESHNRFQTAVSLFSADLVTFLHPAASPSLPPSSSSMPATQQPPPLQQQQQQPPSPTQMSTSISQTEEREEVVKEGGGKKKREREERGLGVIGEEGGGEVEEEEESALMIEGGEEGGEGGKEEEVEAEEEQAKRRKVEEARAKGVQVLDLSEEDEGEEHDNETMKAGHREDELEEGEEEEVTIMSGHTKMTR